MLHTIKIFAQLIFCSRINAELVRVLAYASLVLMIFVTGTECPRGYCVYASWVLMIFLTGTAYPHRYSSISSRVLHILTGTEVRLTGTDIFLLGTEYPQGYCVSSRTLKIVYTGCTMQFYQNLSIYWLFIRNFHERWVKMLIVKLSF